MCGHEGAIRWVFLGRNKPHSHLCFSHTVLPHEAACIDMSPFDKATAAVAPAHSFQSPRSRALAKSLLSTTAKTLPSNQSLAEPEIVAVGLWLGHGIVLLKLPSLELLYNEPLPETTASLGTALLPRSILIAQLEEVAFLFAAMGDGSMYYYTIDCTTGKLRCPIFEGVGDAFSFKTRDKSASLFLCT